MKKKIIMIISAIVFVIILLLLLNSNNKVYTEIDGIKYAILVDGEESSSFPSGDYKVSVDCINADGYWDSISNKLIVRNISGNVACDIEFSSITSGDYLNTYITSLSGTTQGTGEVVNENGIRFEGKDPDNYIRFNNKLWRIMGVFSTEYDSDNDGIADTTDNLVKLINTDSIGSFVWNKTNTGDWSNSSLYYLLNGAYYDWETNKSSVGTYCYGYMNTIMAQCNFSVKGIQDGYRSMIAKAKWYLGGAGSTLIDTYNSERDENSVPTGCSSSVLGYIGIMYLSDYFYGVLASNCSRYITWGDFCNGANGRTSCCSDNWLAGRGDEWTITKTAGNSTFIINTISPNGTIGRVSGNTGKSVHPTLYLSPDVYRISGTGTNTDPYIIGLATSN